MAQRDRFLIAPYTEGMVRNVKPFLIPDDAFQSLYNMYVWRGFVRKRVGSSLLNGVLPTSDPQLLSRLRIQVAETTADDASGTVPSGTPLGVIGQLFSVGDDQIFTVNQLGSPAPMLNTGGGTGTYDTATGDFVLTGVDPVPDMTPIYFYPALPVMDFPQLYTTTTNFERYFAFDTRFAYEYQGSGGWQRLDAGASTWSGTDFDFFSWINYQGNFDYEFFLFVVNNVQADGIRYFDAGTNTWVQYSRSFSADSDTDIYTCRIVIQFKNRLLLLNTLENDGSGNPVRYQNRCRFSQLGSIGATEAFYEPPETYGRGGFVDAPTQQQIISAQILRDRLIVYFEQSTWELVYQNNEIAPFKWINLNIELGAESTNSLIPFDKGVFGIGDVGIHTCNGVNVERIDNKIPDEVYEISNINNGLDRVFGIRDYDAELVYWSIPNVNTPNSTDLVYPNQLIVYNYRNDTWSLFDDSITAFGYIRLNNGFTWEQLDFLTWSQWNTPWGAGQEQSRQPRVIAGNQEGFTFYMDRDIPFNAASLQITNLTIIATDVTSSILNLDIINHNTVIGDALRLQSFHGTGNITDLNDTLALVISILSVDSIQVVVNVVIAGTYLGGGTAALVSNINILTKQYNFYLDQGVNFTINKLDMLVTNTPKIDEDDPGGQFSVKTFPNSGSLDAFSDIMIMPTSPYNPLYYPYEVNQTRLWHTIYPSIYGSFIQLVLYWEQDQLLDPRISLVPVEIHAMDFYTQVTDSRLQ